MFKGLRLTGGIGAKTAHCILWKYTKGALENQLLTFAMSANEKKAEKSAKYKEESIRQRCSFKLLEVLGKHSSIIGLRE